MPVPDPLTPPPQADRLAPAEAPPKVSFWLARIWQGMTLPIWLRLLARHRFRVAPSRRALAVRFTLFGVFNSLFAGAERIAWGRQIRRAKVPPPLFVIGHWRTGTTWLHELLALDRHFHYPTTYQCAAPHHFLITQDWLPHLLRHMMAERRPMDNMPVGWGRPQEDEFALCNLGLPSPYLQWAFPNDPGLDAEALDLHGLSASDRRRWGRGLVRFLQHLAVSDPRRQVLKSPTHTARVGLLRQLFPGAQFVHIVRDPYVVFSSTVNLWKRLWYIMGLQVPDFHNLAGYVFDMFTTMYRRFFHDLPALGPGELCEVKYEDLRRDVVGEMRRVYVQLGLGGFDEVEPKLKGYVEETRDYRTNKFELDDALRRDIAEKWGEYFDRYGYDR